MILSSIFNRNTVHAMLTLPVCWVLNIYLSYHPVFVVTLAQLIWVVGTPN